MFSQPRFTALTATVKATKASCHSSIQFIQMASIGRDCRHISTHGGNSLPPPQCHRVVITLFTPEPRRGFGVWCSGRPVAINNNSAGVRTDLSVNTNIEPSSSQKGTHSFSFSHRLEETLLPTLRIDTCGFSQVQNIGI